jgi:NhaA family Na+:H+ antiporter
MNRVIRPLRDFLKRESASGVLILLAAIAGLLIANSPISTNYFKVLDFEFNILPSSFSVELTVLKSINYVLMTIFFFVVGLEIKRELSSGHLSTMKSALTPVIAALGGMVLPAVIYLVIAADVDANGWAVPVATDIALAVGLLALAGGSVVPSLRSFLLALAVIDDIGAILIIAFVYSIGIDFMWSSAAVIVVFLLYLLRKVGFKNTYLYILVGIALWYCLYKTGIHPTLTGVILGLMTPNIVKENSTLKDGEDGQVSIIEWLEEKIHPWSSFVIVPLFAFANTGVEISKNSISNALVSPIAWGIFVGLVIGKPIGILLSVVIAKKIGLAQYPSGAQKLDLFATGSAAGIGFTVAIFIANLAFKDPMIQDLAIISIIMASIASALISLLLFKVLLQKSKN